MKSKHLFFIFFALVSTVVWADGVEEFYKKANGLKKSELKAAMMNIIGTANVLEYGSGEGKTWSGFYKTDRLENDQVLDRYSNDVRYFYSTVSAVSGMNIEHSFPKSWWGGANNQAYKDLYNLMPCEASINSSKSNYCMGQVTSADVDNGCTKVGKGPTSTGSSSTLWEPADKWKGDFARNYFYMVTAYSNLTWTSRGLDMLENTQWPTLQKWAYTLLLQWSREDPVDEIEKKRNEAVYKIQGNRNPFIDYPNLAEYIWGDSINVAFSADGSNQGIVIPDDDDDDDDEDILLEETFASSLGDFTCVHVDGAASTMWINNTTYSCAVANAYSVGKVADDWLVSPLVDLSDYESATLTFDHATGYHSDNDASQLFKVVVSDEYNGIPEDVEWYPLNPAWPQITGSSWAKFITSGEIDLTPYVGAGINVAFRYQSNENQCWGWELKNFKITGVKKAVDGVDDNFMSPVFTDQAIFTINGAYIGKELPRKAGMYVVKQGNRVFKKLVR